MFPALALRDAAHWAGSRWDSYLHTGFDTLGCLTHMSIKIATDMGSDNNFGFPAPQEIKYAPGQRFAYQHGNTHAQLLGNMQSTICEPEAANSQTQAKKTRPRTNRCN